MPRMPDYIVDGIMALIRPYYPALDARGLRSLLSAAGNANPRGITCGEAARLLGVSKRTLQRRVAGLTPIEDSGGHGFGCRRFRLEDLVRAAGAGAVAAEVEVREGEERMQEEKER